MLEKKLKNTNLFFLSILVLIFFATNSLLCRAALVDNHIDPFSFTFFRVFFAIITLYSILFLFKKNIKVDFKTNWGNSFFLFLYAISFSYAYIMLDAGLGALILFASVQLSMVLYAFFKKETITAKKIFGIFLALIGLFLLLLPSGEYKLSLFHFFLMSIAGISWAVYSILGKYSTNFLEQSADNFLKAFIFVLLFFFVFVDLTKISTYGIFLAFISGSITSGIAYALWYFVLGNIQIVTASVIQLIVPVIAIFLGYIFLQEDLNFKLILSSLLILFGIFITINKK